MVYVILLDNYQVDPANYATSFEGTLAKCKAKKNHDGRRSSLLKSDYAAPQAIEKVSLRNGASEDSGWIKKLTPIISGDAVIFHKPSTSKRKAKAPATSPTERKKPAKRSPAKAAQSAGDEP